MLDSIWHDGLTLRSWQLKNFKSVRATSVELAPLTVIVGANSAGKSTLLQSIRVAAQAANSEGEFFPLNGEQIRVGTFEETRFAGVGDTSEPICLGGQFHLGSPDYYPTPAVHGYSSHAARRRPRRPRDLAADTRLDWQVQLHGTPPGQSAATNVVAVAASTRVGGEPRASLSAAARRARTRLSFGHQVTYDATMASGEEDPLELVDVNVVGGFPRTGLTSEPLAYLLFETWYDVRQQLTRASLTRGGAARTRTRLQEEAAFPKESVAVGADAIAATIIEDLSSVLADIPVELFDSPNLQRAVHIRLRELSMSRPPRQGDDWTASDVAQSYATVTDALNLGGREGLRVVELPELLADSVDGARDFLSTRVQHLGPLRMDPQVVYRSSPASHPGFIGTKGEYCASVLQTSGHTPVINPPRVPGSSAARRDLLSVVNDWAVYLGIGEAFSTIDRGRLGLQLSVRQADVNLDLDLTSVGTGVSQILPVLVMCLQAPPGSLLLIEQPELHLNPGVQQRLADFLLAVVTSGRQLIVETHSDYLVTRLRRRTAEDLSGVVRERIAIVFAERREGTTTYTAVKPAADGSMTDWPKGFFDEAAEDSKALLETLLTSLKR